MLFVTGGTVLFRRAVAVDRPDVRPKRQSDGVWAPSDIKLAKMTTRYEVSREVADKVGFVRQTGWNAFGTMALGGGSQGQVSAEVVKQFQLHSEYRAAVLGPGSGCKPSV